MDAFFRKNFEGKRLVSLVRAYIRRGYCNGDHQSLNIAIRNGLSEVALLLIGSEVDFQLKDGSGTSSFELAMNQELYDVAYEIVKRGYPYSSCNQDQKLNVPNQNLKKFDQLYF